MSAHRTPFIVVGVVLAVLSFGVLAVGGVSLWADDQKDSGGFITTDAHEFKTTSSALVTENMDLDLDGAGWLVQGDDFGKVKLAVDGAGSEPVFVGIAKTRDVERYLDGVAHSTVTDVEYGPFSASYEDVGGDRRPMPPANAGIWDASATGTGVQDLKWTVADGDWSIVVMNADGSPGVETDIAAGARVPWLDELGWSAVGGGLLLLTGGVVLILLGFRRPPTAPLRRATPAVAGT